jgi:hypothetical protein
MKSFPGLLKKLILLLVAAVPIWSCQPEGEEITNDPNAILHFSRQTVYFDTVFSTVGSIAKRLKVYNRSKNAVVIENISLGNPTGSPYSLYINGIKGKSFGHQMLMGNDSLLVLVEVKLEPGSTKYPFLVTDSIRFLTNGNLQDVKLVSWGQDVHFINKTTLTRDTTWLSDKPLVLLDTIKVGQGSTLTIEGPTRVFANPNATLVVAGRLNIAGTLEKPVLLTNSRLDIKNAYGQWGGIVILPGSNGNRINFCTIRNSVYGVYIGSPLIDSRPDLILSNTKIENAIFGLVGLNADIQATNTLIANCAEYVVANIGEGNYYYNHSTFSNSLASLYIAREKPSMFFTNYYQYDDEIIMGDLSVQMHNSIVWGNLKDEILFDIVPDVAFDALFNHSLLKTGIADLNQNNNILNQDPRFLDSYKYNHRLHHLSPAIDNGDANYRIAYDLAGNERDQQPDMGAFERIITE